ncbi:MAG: hypothetical protein K5768_04220 [Firmicutes bacterium]|nr:hypothetical protein [Bacillota bacterium]
MKTVLVDFRISEKSCQTLENIGYTVVKTSKEPNLANPLCGHPDMIICKLKNHDFVGKPTLRGFFNNINFFEGKSDLSNQYPYDIAYNCALVGNSLFCNEKYTDEVILEYCKNNGIRIINTKQGYAKCSICIVSDNAIITADKSIYNAAIKNYIDVLMVENKGIVLDGYNEGFIGGATGLLEEDLLAVNGSIERHEDYNKIKSFCESYGVKIISLSDEPICDVGSIIRL